MVGEVGMAHVRLRDAEVEVEGFGTVTHMLTFEAGRVTGVEAHTPAGSCLLSVVLDDAMRVTVIPRVARNGVRPHLDAVCEGALRVLQVNPTQLAIAIEERLALDMAALRSRVRAMEEERARGGMSDEAVTRASHLAMALGGRMGALAIAQRAITEHRDTHPSEAPPIAFAHGEPEPLASVARSRPGTLGGAVADALDGTVSVVPLGHRCVPLPEVARFALERGYRSLEPLTFGSLAGPSWDATWAGDVHSSPARFLDSLVTDRVITDDVLVAVGLVPPVAPNLRDFAGRLADGGVDPVLLAFDAREAIVGRASALLDLLERDLRAEAAPSPR